MDEGLGHPQSHYPDQPACINLVLPTLEDLYAQLDQAFDALTLEAPPLGWGPSPEASGDPLPHFQDSLSYSPVPDYDDMAELPDPNVPDVAAVPAPDTLG